MGELIKGKPMCLDQSEVDLLQSGLYELGIEPVETMVQSFVTYLDELLRWNHRTNLIGTTDRSQVIIRHIFDSLTIYDLLKAEKKSILDLGAGAGFPSLPLSIVDSSLVIVGVEKRKKRAAFLRNICTLLYLDNYSVFEGDVRELSTCYDIMLARGVGEVATLYRLAQRILKENGVIIAFKGKIKEIDKEMARLKEKVRGDKSVHLRIQKVHVPYLDEEERNIVIIET